MDEKQLLRKRHWTGEDTGKALILDLISSYKQMIAGVADRKPLFGNDKLNRMIARFSESREDVIAYNSYCKLQGWIMQYQAVANANLQRFNACCNELISIHDAAESAENQFRYIERLPYIVTQKQYDELKARRIEEQLSSTETETVFALIIRAMLYYGHELEMNPKKANPLKAIKKKYMDQPIEGERLRDLCAGLEEEPEGTLQRALWSTVEAFTPITGGLNIPKTKWELVEYCVKGDTSTLTGVMSATARIFPAVHRANWEGKTATHEDYQEQISAFRDEFPELVGAIVKALDALQFIPGGSSVTPFAFSAVPADQWDTTIFTWRELYDGDFLGFREIVECDFNIFNDRRALANGVAIIRPSDFVQTGKIVSSIDREGNYEEPDMSTFYANDYGLNAYLPDNEESGDNIERITATRQTLEEALRILLAYDKSLELIAEEIRIPDFTIFRAYSSRCMERTVALNALYEELYNHIAEIDYQDKQRKAAKLQALQDVFPPFDIEELKIPERRIEEAAHMLEGLEAFKYGRTGTNPGYNFLDHLTARGGGEDE